MDGARKEITALDSLKCFLYSIIMPIIFNAAFVMIATVLSVISKMEYQAFIDQWLIKGLLYVLNSATFLCIFIYYYKRNSISFKDTIEYKKNYNVWSILIVIIMGIVLVAGCLNFIGLINYGLSLIGYAPTGDLPIKLNSVENMLLSIMLWAVIPAICEELLFRGIIFQGLLQKFKPSHAVLIGGAFFMLMHGSLQQTVYQFLLGCALCLVYYMTKNIFYPMLLHFLNNGLVIFIDYLNLAHGFDMYSSFAGAWACIWPILVFALTVFVVLVLFYYLGKVNKNKYEHIVSTGYEVMEKPVVAVVNKWMIISLVVSISLWLINTIWGWFE